MRDHACFLKHIRAELQPIATKLPFEVSRCGSTHVVSKNYNKLLDRARCAVHLLSSMTLADHNPSAAQLFCFVIDQLCALGDVLTLFAERHTSPFVFSVVQDPVIWLLARTAFDAAAAAAPEALEALERASPDRLALCGFLAVLFRTPFAFALLMAKSKRNGEPVVVRAALRSCDCVRRRPFVGMIVDSTVGASDLWDDRLSVEILRWTCPSESCGPGQAFMEPCSEQLFCESLATISRSNEMSGCASWHRLAAQVRLRLELERGTPNALAAATAERWNSVWNTVTFTLKCCEHLLQRPQFNIAFVLHLATSEGLRCIARRVSLTRLPHCEWSHVCACGLENMAREFLNRESLTLQPSTKRYARRQTRAIQTRPFDCPFADQTTAAVVADVYACMQDHTRFEFRHASSGFTGVASFTCVSFKSK